MFLLMVPADAADRRGPDGVAVQAAESRADRRSGQPGVPLAHLGQDTDPSMLSRRSRKYRVEDRWMSGLPSMMWRAAGAGNPASARSLHVPLRARRGPSVAMKFSPRGWSG